MPEDIESTDKVGSVSASRYAEIVAELRKLVETASRIRFTIGDYALEVEPVREAGGQERGNLLFHGQGLAVPAGRGHRGVLQPGGQGPLDRVEVA